MSTATVATPYVRILVEGAFRFGVDVKDLVDRLGLAEVIEDPEERVDQDTVYRLWEEVAARSNNPHLGLHLAEHLEPGAFGVLDYAMRNARDLGAGYRQIERYSSLIHSGAEVRLNIEGDNATLGYTLDARPSGSPRQAAEFIVATWLVLGRQITETHIAPKVVRFQHPAKSDLKEHHRVLGTTCLEFSCAANEIILDTEVLSRPAVKGDASLRPVLDSYARRLLTEVAVEKDFLTKVRGAIAEKLRAGQVASLSETAKTMKITGRTLQRRLKEHEAVFQVVLDEVRADFGKRYLLDSGLSVAEVAFLLGFSQQSSFTRAFKRWTSLSPAEFRVSAKS